MTKVLKELYFDTIPCRKDSNLKVVAKKIHNKFKSIKSLYYGGNQMFVLQEGLNLSWQHLEPWLERAHVDQENKCLKYFLIINYPDLLFSNLPSSGICFPYLICTGLITGDEKVISIGFKTNPITNSQLPLLLFCSINSPPHHLSILLHGRITSIVMLRLNIF